MSLSKYFEKSDAFLPDKIVKNAESHDKPWTPSPLPGKQPFTADKLPSMQRQKAPETEVVQKRSNELSSSTREPVTVPQAEATAVPEVTAQPEQPAPARPPIPQPVDLSRYMDKEEAEKAIEDAYLRGCQDGKDGVLQDFVDATNMLVSASQQIDNIRELLITNSSRELQEFALAIAERILRISLQEQDETLIATIEEALVRAVKSDEFTVYVNPEDYDFAVAKAPELVTGISGLNNLVVKRDGSIERGGAKLESDNCTIDATVASQLETIREEIKKKP